MPAGCPPRADDAVNILETAETVCRKVARVPGTRHAAAAAAALALFAASGAARGGDPQRPRGCLPLVAGSTGLPVETAAGSGGFGAAAPPGVARTLPDDVVFRTRDGELRARVRVRAPRRPDLREARRAAGRGAAGRAVARARASAVPGRARQRDLRRPPAPDRARRATARSTRTTCPAATCRRSAGPGAGGRTSGPGWACGCRTTSRDWATSEFTGAETLHRHRRARPPTPIGVATVYLLRGGGRRITYLDPWLPADESREVCGPRRGTHAARRACRAAARRCSPSAAVASSTRACTTSTSRARTPSSAPSRGSRTAPRATRAGSCPGRIGCATRARRGTITDRITHRQDRHRRGRPAAAGRGPRPRRARRLLGEADRPLAEAPGASSRTGGRLRGERLPPAPRRALLAPRRPPLRGRDRRRARRGPRLQRRVLARDAARARSRRAAARPAAALQRRAAPGHPRARPRRHPARVQRRDRGAARLFARAARRRPAAQAWIDAHLGGRRIATAPIAVTTTRMRFLAQCWALTLDGRPARPDALRIPPDLGTGRRAPERAAPRRAHADRC